MKVLELQPSSSSRELGRAHGEDFRHLVREIGEIRTELVTVNGRFRSTEGVLEAARAHLPVLERFCPSLHAELMGIAEGAGVDPAVVVVVNHYTDLKDLDPDPFEPGEEDCSALFARTAEGPVLAQTWDMHGSAAPYLMMLHVPEHEGAPEAWLLSITGCLGMAGLNAAGVGITINNLRSTDAHVGIVWPALVRRVLYERTAEAGRDVVLGAPLGSGHHYLVASAEAAFGIETSGEHRKVVYDGGKDTYVHTNHCEDPEIEACTTIGPESMTRERHDFLSRSIASKPIQGRAEAWRRLGSHEGYPRSVCTHLAGPKAPHRMLTCGAVAMDLTRRDLWAAPGCVHEARPHVLRFDTEGDA